MAWLLAGGTALWLAYNAPRYLGARSSASYFWAYTIVVLVVAAAAARPVPDRSALWIATGLVGPALALAGWTTPRGDGDGLWVLTFPFLLFVAAGAALTASLARWSPPPTRPPAGGSPPGAT